MPKGPQLSGELQLIAAPANEGRAISGGHELDVLHRLLATPRRGPLGRRQLGLIDEATAWNSIFTEEHLEKLGQIERFHGELGACLLSHGFLEVPPSVLVMPRIWN